MKVLWIAPFPSNVRVHPAPWLSTLAHALVTKKNIELTVLNDSYTATQDIETFTKDNINFIDIKTPRWRYDILTLYQYRINKMNSYLKNNYKKYDLIHIHGSEHQYEAVVEGVDIPKVLSIQGIISEYKKILTNKLSLTYFTWSLASYYEKKYLPAIENFSCRTHWDKAWISKIAPKSTIYHNWEMIREKFFEDHYKDNKEYILFLGGTNGIKGYKEMLQAFNIVRKKLPVRLIIVGNASMQAIEETIKEYNLQHIKSGDIDCRGFQNAEGIVKAYSESFCFVHPSYIDNSPNSVCEAQIAGLPVIATDVGGLSSLIEDGKTGLLTNLNPASIAERIVMMYEDDTLRNTLSFQSKTVARSRHNPDTILNNTIEIYKGICK